MLWPLISAEFCTISLKKPESDIKSRQPATTKGSMNGLRYTINKIGNSKSFLNF
jgi:hypothetical protein